jgi:hypothetical protein
MPDDLKGNRGDVMKEFKLSRAQAAKVKFYAKVCGG